MTATAKKPTPELVQERTRLYLLACELELVPPVMLAPLVDLLECARYEAGVRCLTAPTVAEKLYWWEVEKTFRQACQEGYTRG